MLDRIFSYESWDALDGLSAQFYDCVLLINFGPFAQGQKIDTIVFDEENSLLVFDDVEIPIQVVAT